MRNYICPDCWAHLDPGEACDCRDKEKAAPDGGNTGGAARKINLLIVYRKLVKKSMDYYEIRRGRDVLCQGTVPYLGYPPERLKEMARNGIYLYKNGKRVKLCEVT